MLSGDLSTMALADVLQWVDSIRGRALVSVERPDGEVTWLSTEDRMVTAASPPEARGVLATDGSPQDPGPCLSAVALEQLYDLFLSPEGKFELRTSPTLPSPSVAVSTPIQFLVMEGLRQLDELPRLEETYPTEEARLAATDTPAEGLGPVHAAIHRLAHDAPSLGEARLVLGLSRPALLRRVDELRQRGLVEVEGTPHGPDIPGSLVAQAQVLLREEQFAEAAHVFRSLLTSHPADKRLRRLLEEAERRRIESIYRRIGPTDVVSQAPDFAGKLRGADQAIVDCLGRPRSVAVLVLVSPLREIETLAALERLIARGAVRTESAD